MYKHLTKYILVGSILATAFACDDEDYTGDSTMTPSSPTVSIDAPFGTNVSFIEKDTTFEFTVTLSEPQIVDVAVYITVGDGSATEGEDFALGANRLVIPAYRTSAAGSITFSNDEDVEEEESILITVGDVRTANASLTPVTFQFTVGNVDVVPGPAEIADFDMSWAFADPQLATADVCGIDVDLTFQTQGTAPYDDDLFGYAASSAACTEHGPLVIADMVDGYVYDIWVLFYGGVDYGDLSAMTINIDFAREHSDFAGSLVIEGVFESRMQAEGAIVGTIERNGDVLTVKNPLGEVVGEGRVRGIQTQTVKKPF